MNRDKAIKYLADQIQNTVISCFGVLPPDRDDTDRIYSKLKFGLEKINKLAIIIKEDDDE